MKETSKKRSKNEDFKVIFKKLELKNNREIFQLTKDIKVVVNHIENQEEVLEEISVASIDANEMYLSTGV